MDNQPYRLKDILPALVQHNIKHAGEFKNPALGKETLINNVEDMKKHVIYTLFHPETKSFKGHGNRDCFYNVATNTVVIINPGKDQNGNILGGTAFRPKDKELYFHKLWEEEANRLEQKPTVHQQGGIVALRPEVAREFAKEYVQQMGKDVSMGQKDNPQPHGQGKPVTAGDKDQTKERLVSVKGQGQNQASQPGKTPISKPIELEQKKQPVRQRTK